MPKKPTKKTLRAKEWKAFADYIKQRDCRGEDMDGKYGNCCTCNKRTYLGTQDCQAGHFISRRIKTVKYDDRNVHIQCAYCNLNMNEKFIEYERFIIRMYGVEELKRLKKAQFEYGGIVYKDFGMVEFRERIQMWKDKQKELVGEYDTFNIEDIPF